MLFTSMLKCPIGGGEIYEPYSFLYASIIQFLNRVRRLRKLRQWPFRGVPPGGNIF